MRALGVKIECGAHSTCREGFDGVHTYCECHAGYDYLVEDGVTSERDCVDIDACAEGYVNDCKANTECVNGIDGTYACNCLPGYESADAKLNDCTNIDECTSVTNPHNCDANAQCSDTKGAFTCSCNQYWEGDGYTCTDIDECDALNPPNNCDENATGGDTIGSFECQCNAGYRGDGITCDDIDECAEGSNDCDVNATCTNTLGGFICACNA